MALTRFKKALADYAAVVRTHPNDADARRKHDECQKIVRRIAFEKAISVDHDKKSISESIDLSTMSGLRLELFFSTMAHQFKTRF